MLLISKDDKHNKHFLLWLVLTEIVAITVVMPLIKSEAVLDFAQVERHLSLAEVGFENTMWVEEQGLSWYDGVFRQTGIERAFYNFVLPSKQEIERSKGLEELGTRVVFPTIRKGLDGLFESLERFMSRLAMLCLWLPTAPLIVVPAVLDGMMTWRRRQFSFDYASPLVHGFAAKIVAYVVVGLPLFLMVPIPVPPLMYPFLWIILGMAGMQFAAHTQKRI